MASLMVVPLRIHVYLKVVPLVQVPGFAVRVDPTLVVPVMVGTAAVSVPLAIASVFAEVFVGSCVDFGQRFDGFSYAASVDCW